MNPTTSAPSLTSAGFAQCLEGYLRRVLERIEQTQQGAEEPGKGPGAPQKLPSAVLWTQLLLCVLCGVKSLRGVWRTLVWQG